MRWPAFSTARAGETVSIPLPAAPKLGRPRHVGYSIWSSLKVPYMTKNLRLPSEE